MNQEQQNMLTMIGCNKETFLQVLNKAIGKVILSSGSWYSDFYLMDKGSGYLAIFDYKGNLKQCRQ